VQSRVPSGKDPSQYIISNVSLEQSLPGNYVSTSCVPRYSTNLVEPKTKTDLQVVPLFFHDFVIASRNDSPFGWLEFLPGLFKQVSDDSALYQAVYAAAYANIAQKRDSLELHYEAIGYYSKALRLVNASLAQPSLASRDVTMTAVVLLGIYEVCIIQIMRSRICSLTNRLKCITGSLNTFAKDLSLCHIHGLGALASLRGVLFTTGLDLSLLEIACCQMVG